MKTLKVYSKGGLVILKPDGDLAYVYDAGDVLSASNNSTISTGIDITDTTTSQVIFSAVDYRAIEDESGTDLNSSRAAVVTDLNAIFEKKILDDFVVKDENSDNSGTTKIRHKAGTAGADRDVGGTLELDTHAASIGLYGSYLKITEDDLSNTTGKTAAYGRLQVYLENADTPVEVLDMAMSSLVQAPVVDLNTSSLDVSGDVTFSSAAGTVTFSGDTSGIAYADISGTPTIPTATSDLTNDSGFITSANHLVGQKLEFETKGSSYSQGWEGTIVKYGTDTLQAGKAYVYTSSGWTAADADVEGKTKGLFGIALGSDADVDGLFVRGIWTSSLFSGYSAGDTLYISLNEGAITNSIASHTTGDFVRVVGYALASGVIYLDPSPDYIELS